MACNSFSSPFRLLFLPIASSCTYRVFKPQDTSMPIKLYISCGTLEEMMNSVEYIYIYIYIDYKSLVILVAIINHSMFFSTPSETVNLKGLFTSSNKQILFYF